MKARGVCALVLSTVAIAVAPATAGAVGELVYDTCYANNVSGCTDLPGDPLMNLNGVAVSPSGGAVYTAARGSGAVGHFFRGSQGELAWDGCVSSDGSGGNCVDVPGAGTPLAGAFGVTVAPSGAVYVASQDASTVSHFFTAPAGQIVWDGCVSSDGSGGWCTDVAGSGSPLGTVTQVAVSPIGAVYAAATVAGTVSHFFAADAGQIIWDGCLSNDGSGAQCGDIPGSGSPLGNPFGLVASPDSGSLYVASATADTVSHFFLVPGGGQIVYDGCVSGDGSAGTCADVPGSGSPLNGAAKVAISPDGRSLYLASYLAHSISYFSVAPGGGQITYQGCLADDGADGCVDLPNSPIGETLGVAVSPDGRSVYTTSQTAHSIAQFSRDAQGALKYEGCLANTAAQGCVDLPGTPLSSAVEVALSPDGSSVYVVSSGSNTLTHFFRARAGGDTGGGGRGGGGGSAKVPRCGGKRPTIIGTPGNDKLKGTRRADVIVGLAGKDKLSGLQGNDRICGGAGNDTLGGGPGNDRLSGEAGKDKVSGDAGNDTASGGSGKDRVLGGPGRDKLNGGPSRDLVNGGSGKDRCAGRDNEKSC
jgi:Ca2+-binding RTX toxin-like protein